MLDHPSGKELSHQHLTEQGGLHEQIQRFRYVLLRLKLHPANVEISIIRSGVLVKTTSAPVIRDHQLPCRMR
jgi:hypothetical protein